MDPSLTPGVGFHLQPDGSWKAEKIPSKVISEAKFSGFLEIEGVKSSVFETKSKDQWAQKTPPAGLNISSKLLRVAARIAGVSVKWTPPSLEEEEEELTRVADEEGLDMPALFAAAHAAKLRPLTNIDWQRLENTDSYGIQSVNEATDIAEGYGKDVDSIIGGMVHGAGIPAAIILERADGSITLVAGNARLMAAKALGQTPDVLWITAP